MPVVERPSTTSSASPPLRRRLALFPKGRAWLRLLVLPVLLLLAGAVYGLWSPGLDVRDGRHNLGRNGLWVGHGWLGGDDWFRRNQRDNATFDDPNEVRRFFDRAAEAQTFDLFPHLCPATADGALPSMDDGRVRRFLATAREHPGGTFRVMPWVGGVLDRDCFPDRPDWRTAFVANVRALLDQYPDFAGVQVNIEPCPSGNEGFLRLLEELRAVLPEGKILSVAAYPPPTWWHPHPEVHWDEAYFRAVAARCNQMAVMMYDAGQKLRKPYVRLMADWTREVLAWAGDTPVLLGVPVYDDADSGYHDPAVENLENALSGIHAGLSWRGGPKPPYQGVAVYADWEWDERERAYWREHFRHRQGNP